jgi:transcriptional regulator with XRE-family HTH domain
MFSGEELRNLRQLKRLSKGDVSDRTGLSLSTLSRLESGLSVPSIETLIRLANSMKTPLKILLSKIGILNGNGRH